jgi:hypothetical protein
MALNNIHDIEFDPENLTFASERPFNEPPIPDDFERYHQQVLARLGIYPRIHPESFQRWLNDDLEGSWDCIRKYPGIAAELHAATAWLLGNAELIQMPPLKRRIIQGLTLCAVVNNVTIDDPQEIENCFLMAKGMYNVLKRRMEEIRNMTAEERDKNSDAEGYTDMTVVNNMILYFRAGITSPDIAEFFINNFY